LRHLVLGVIVLLFLGGFVGGRMAILATLVRMTRRIRAEEDEAALEQAEEEVIGQSPVEWAEMHVHLLQSLEDESTPEEYQQALEIIRDAIDRRLERGGWQERRVQLPGDDGRSGSMSRRERL
jgi:hypothetical protein